MHWIYVGICRIPSLYCPALDDSTVWGTYSISLSTYILSQHHYYVPPSGSKYFNDYLPSLPGIGCCLNVSLSPPSRKCHPKSYNHIDNHPQSDPPSPTHNVCSPSQ